MPYYLCKLGLTILLLLVLVTITMVESSSTNENAASTTINDDDEKIPQLPPPDPNDSKIPSIKLGETISFEQWGPIILNTDGTIRRIANWDTLTEKEKEVSWRRISKRNEERRLTLLQKQEEQNNNAAVDDAKEL